MCGIETLDSGRTDERLSHFLVICVYIQKHINHLYNMRRCFYRRHVTRTCVQYAQIRYMRWLVAQYVIRVYKNIGAFDRRQLVSLRVSLNLSSLCALWSTFSSNVRAAACIRQLFYKYTCM